MDDGRFETMRPAQGGALANVRSSLAYDAITRLPLVIWFALCASVMGQRLQADFMAAPAVDATLVLDMLARGSSLAFVLLVIVILSVRRPAIARSPGILPRLVAFGGAFSITAIVLLEPTPHSLGISVASLVLMGLGYAFSCYAVLHLGRSLSLMAEARKLVTTGPYGIVRHPLYTAEAVASVGLLLQYFSAAGLALWVVHIALQLGRIHYEEIILRDTFPEYEEYSRRVARLIPGVH